MKNSDAHLKGDEKSKRQSALQIAERQQKLAEARALIRKYIPEGRSLADELIQERREAAKREP